MNPRMTTVFSVFLLALSGTSCRKPAQLNAQDASGLGTHSATWGSGAFGNADIPQSPEPFVQPTRPPGQSVMVAPQSDVNQVPEGLTAVGDGKVLPERNTLIYIHGWTGDGTAESVRSAEAWQDPANHPNGFNTLVFRWHRDAFSQEIFPRTPEEKIWLGVAEKSVKEYKRLARSLGSKYNKEIRIVGHSLGAQVATYLAYTLQRERYPLFPARLELLDPQFLPSSTLPEGARNVQGIATALPETGGNEIGALMHSMLFSLKTIPPQIPFVVYASMRGLTDLVWGHDKIWESVEPPHVGPTEERNLRVAYRVFDGMNYQAMGKGWLANLVPSTGGGLGGFLRHLTSLLTEQHVRIREYYFDSIKKETGIPRVLNPEGGLTAAFSARTETSFLAKMFGHQQLRQVAGFDTIDIGDDQYEVVKRARCEERAGVVNLLCINF